MEVYMLPERLGVCVFSLFLSTFIHNAESFLPNDGQLQNCVTEGALQGNLALNLLSGDCDVGISLSGGGNGITTVTVNDKGDGYVYDYQYDYDNGDDEDDEDDSNDKVTVSEPQLIVDPDPVPVDAPVIPVGGGGRSRRRVGEADSTVGGDASSSPVSQPRSTGPGDGGRPAGDWSSVETGHVRLTPKEVWELTPNFGNVLVYGFGDLAASVLAQDNNFTLWTVELQSGENMIFEVVETHKRLLYHVATIVEHGSDVFPGINIEGSRLYFQALKGKPEGTTQLEIGWSGSPHGDGISSSSSDPTLLAVRSLSMEMIVRLEDKFGGNCEFARAERTIEARCNNLRTPSLGAANQPLRRLEKHDPAFPDGVSEPSGPKDISPRLISNMLFSQSPGAEVLDERLHTVSQECLKGTSKGITWEVCPYQRTRATRGREVVYNLDWQGTELNGDKMVVMQFGDESAGCRLDVVFTCDGQKRLDMANNPCKSSSNQFLHPNACLIEPGNDNVLTNADQLSDMFWSMGQFIDHDLGLTPTEEISEGKQPGFKNSRIRRSGDQFPIDIPKTDFFFRNATMEFERSVFSSDPDHISHINQHSAFADLGQVYGVDFLRANALRSFQDGKLKMGPQNLLPLNKIDGIDGLGAKLDNAPNATDGFFAAGDIRANEQTLLLSLHTLWAREHNLVCEELKGEFPEWDDEQMYQMARSIVISEYQSVVWGEWLPLLLGLNEVHPDDYSYSIEVDPSINAVFSTVAFRFGHSMVGSYLWKQGPGSRGAANLELLPLRGVFFRPKLVSESGIDPFLRGGCWHLAQEVDIKVVDELRNFLFTEDPEEAHLDLIALNIQRGRDMGMPSFNQLRDAYDLPKYEDFSEISKDERIYRILKIAYLGDIDKVDAFVGGLAEAHVEGSVLGETFHTIIKDQFTRMRDGDRFFYKGIHWDNTMLTAYPRLEAIIADEVRIADIISRNTDVSLEEVGIGPRNSCFQL